MSLKFKPDIRVFVFETTIDLRAGFDRLSYLVREKLSAKLVDGDLFIFFGKDRRKVKMICYDGTGVVLINKRLERGRFMSLLDLEHREITTQELDSLLHGGVVRRPIFGQMPLTKLPRGNQLDPYGADRAREQHRGSAPVLDPGYS
jgi:transposase